MVLKAVVILPGVCGKVCVGEVFVWGGMCGERGMSGGRCVCVGESGVGGGVWERGVC